MRIVILGGPGSGKKTQTGLLAEKFGLKVIVVGDLVKQALAEESERGELLRQQQQAGVAVTDDVVLTLLQERLQQPDLDQGFILDGFPRNLLQALTLDELLLELAIPLDFVLLFEIETDALMERLVGRRTCRSCGTVYNIFTQPTAVDDVCDLCGGRLHQRADDTEETVSSRLHVFDHLTGPLLNHYGKMEKVVRIDGEGEVEVVFARTSQAVDSYLAQHPEQAKTPTAPTEPESQKAAETTLDKQPPSSAKSPASKAGREAKSVGESRSTVKKASQAKAATGKPVKKKASPKEAAAKKAAVKKGGAKKAQSGKTPSQKTAKEPAVKKVAAKKVVKKVVKKAAVRRAAAPEASGKKQVVVKKSTKKPVAKKQVAKPSTKTKAKLLQPMKPTVGKAAAKKAVKKKATPRKAVKKQATLKAGSKKKAAAKAALPKKTAAKKAVRKPAAKKRAKASSPPRR
jgi:adenylate kinase